MKGVPGYGGLTRRNFLAAAGAFSVAAGLPVWAGAYFEEGGFPVRTVEKVIPSFDPSTGLLDGEETYFLTIDGLVTEEASLTYHELRALRQVSQVTDLHCVEGWSAYDLKWGGIRLEEITGLVRPLPGASHIIFHSLGRTAGRPRGQGYYLESMPLDYLLEPQNECMMALDLHENPLPREHGAPLRLVAPYFLGYKNIKFVRRIEFAAEPREGWWTLANPYYKVDAPVPQSRLRRRKREG